MSARSENENSSRQTRPATAACEACRKVKMRCIRSPDQQGTGWTEPCERCKRTSRACTIPEPRPLGRKRGATGRYHGVEKAYRKMQLELKKARTSQGAETTDEVADLVLSEEFLRSNHPAETLQPAQRSPMVEDEDSSTQIFNSGASNSQDEGLRADFVSPDFRHSERSHSDREPISNPLALLADASDAAQALTPLATSISPSPTSNMASCMTNPSANPADGSISGRRLLHRPGYVSLGLELDRGALEAGIDYLLAPSDHMYPYSNYFKSPPQKPQRDVGPDIDPVSQGLVTMDEASRLFPVYFARLHPVNGILDPKLHTPEFVRSRSALLFTWIIAITAQFDHGSSSIAKRLRLHGEKLSKHVHTRGYKSVEIVQGYYISLLSATPAETLAQERSWLYTTYAFGVAAELGLDQSSRANANRPNQIHTFDIQAQDATSPDCFSGDSFSQQRMARNRERTWLRILLWERASSASYGRTHTFPETDLTQNIDSWWLDPLADPTDKHTCAFITLRQRLASLQSELRQRAHLTQTNPHWVRELVDSSLSPWCELWLSLSTPDTSIPPSEKLSNIFLHYVYLHGRLWTLSFALHSAIHRELDLDAIRGDCFEAAVNACEIAVRDLHAIGEPLYCMLAPTWAMISYAGVLALKLFPALYGQRVGNDIELLALLSQLAIQLQRAGTTPSHRVGIAALLGQHLMMILKARAMGLKDSLDLGGNNSGSKPDQPYYTGSHDETWSLMPQQTTSAPSNEALVSEYDPFLMTAPTFPGDFTGEGFADFFRDMFGPGFGGVF